MVSTPSKQSKHDRSQTTFDVTPDGLVRLERMILTRTNFEIIDALSIWSVAVGDINPGQLGIRVGDKINPIAGKIAIFVPPFSVMRWCIAPGRLKFVAYCGGKQRPPLVPSKSVLIKTINSIPNSASVTDLQNILSLQTKEQWLTLDSGSHKVELAKARIDQSYHNNTPIAEIAESIGIEHASLTRLFKKHYGIPLVVYRNRLRVFDAHQKLMTQKTSVSDIGLDVGFGSLRQFNREFKKVISNSPSDFQTW